MPEVILITGARAPVALELTRSFKADGHRVILADSLFLPLSRWSNSVDQYYKLPSPVFETHKFYSKLQSIIETEKITHLIPTCEEVFYISKGINYFNCQVWTSKFSIMQSLHNKMTFTEISKQYFKCPETVYLEDFNDWNNSEDYVFKPTYSRFAQQTVIKKKITANYFSDKNYEQDSKEWLVQKYIDGQEICTYSIWDNGQLKGFSAYLPLYRAGKGSGIYFEPFEDQKIYQQIKSFGESLAYHGQLAFDIIIDKNQQAYFLECNPRCTSGAHLINSNLGKMFLGKDPTPNYRLDARCLKLLILLLHPLIFFNQHIRKTRDVIWSFSDTAPQFLQIFSLLEISFIKFRKSVSWLAATTSDIEWNGTDIKS